MMFWIGKKEYDKAKGMAVTHDEDEMIETLKTAAATPGGGGPTSSAPAGAGALQVAARTASRIAKLL